MKPMQAVLFPCTIAGEGFVVNVDVSTLGEGYQFPRVLVRRDTRLTPIERYFQFCRVEKIENLELPVYREVPAAHVEALPDDVEPAPLPPVPTPAG